MKDENRKLINELIVQISKLSEEALDQLYDLTNYEFCSLIGKYITEEELANKVLSLSYLQIYRGSKRFNSYTTDGFDWMCNIVRKLSLKYQKKFLKKQEKKKRRCKEEK